MAAIDGVCACEIKLRQTYRGRRQQLDGRVQLGQREGIVRDFAQLLVQVPAVCVRDRGLPLEGPRRRSVSRKGAGHGGEMLLLVLVGEKFRMGLGHQLALVGVPLEFGGFQKEISTSELVETVRHNIFNTCT